LPPIPFADKLKMVTSFGFVFYKSYFLAYVCLMDIFSCLRLSYGQSRENETFIYGFFFCRDDVTEAEYRQANRRSRGKGGCAEANNSNHTTATAVPGKS
jgi:hypothetical protein